MGKEPLIVSFYTEETPYALEVLELINSCNAFGLDTHIVGVPSKGDWVLNCAMKPFFIRDQLKTKKRPVLWVDADAVFKKCPDFSFLLHADLSLREMKRFSSDPRFKFFSGSLFVNDTERGLQFVEEWCRYCEEKITKNEELEFLDQTSLAALLDKTESLKVHPLPIAYAKVFDLDVLEIHPEEVVIEHYQASRRFRYWSL